MKDLLIKVSETASLENLRPGKLLVNTVNAWSYVVAQDDVAFAEALRGGDVLFPDGQSIVWAMRFLGIKDAPKRRVAGWDFFVFEMGRLQSEAAEAGEKRRVMFMGSSEKVLSLIKERAETEYPMLDVVTYSPPFKVELSDGDSDAMVSAINSADPDLLWIGMTAPKQERWAYTHWSELNIRCHCGTVGAVFDFYAGTVSRAPLWVQKLGLEWSHRLLSNPGRLWKRYIVGNIKFISLIIREKI